MLTENQLEMLGDKAAELMQEAEQDIIADIARRIKKTGRFTETAELRVMALRKAGWSTQKIRVEVMNILNADPEYKKFVANNTKQYKRDVMSAIRQMEKEAAKAGDDIIAEAGDMSYNSDLYAWHQAGETLTKDSSIVKIVEEMGATTGGTLKNLTRTMGFKGPHDFVALHSAYIRYLDKALMKMIMGGVSYDAAVEDSVREMARSGLRSVDYASGRTYQLDTAARMCIRTSAHQLSAKISYRNCDVMNTDLVEVSKHWGARPSHQVWQGKIYSRSGKNKKYPAFKECHYGEADGLCGVNCRHTFHPFFEGISEPTKWQKEPEPKEYGGKMYSYYDATQKQRAMERQIRSTKREIEAMRSIGGDTSELESQKKRQIKEYHKFSNAVQISPKDNRLRVVKGSSDLSKTETLKKHNALAKSNSADILKSKKKERIIGTENFKIPKSKFLKSEYEDIKDLQHSLSNTDVRIWYKAKDAGIINKIDTNKPIKEQAEEAFKMRNAYRTQARELMKDQEERKKLDIEHPNRSFEETVEDKMARKSMTKEQAYKDIIATAGKTNKKVDKSLGLE